MATYLSVLFADKHGVWGMSNIPDGSLVEYIRTGTPPGYQQVPAVQVRITSPSDDREWAAGWLSYDNNELPGRLLSWPAGDEPLAYRTGRLKVMGRGKTRVEAEAEANAFANALQKLMGEDAQ